MTREEIEKLIGDPAEVARQLEQFTADTILLDQRFADLAEHFPGLWAGVLNGKVTVAASQKQLIEQLGTHAAMKRLIVDNTPLILANFDPDFSHRSATNQRAARQRGLRYDSSKKAYVDADGCLIRDRFGQRY